jgi:ABC-2 type transport system permease protein
VIHHVLVRKYAGQSLLLWCSCALALFSFCWVRVWVVSLLDMGQFQTILEQFRDFERFAPIGFDALFTHTGRVAMTFDEPIVIFCIVIWCIARGSDVVSGELGRGTLEMVLSQAVSRSTLLASHAIVSIIGLALLCLLVWAGIGIGISTTTISETIPPPSIRIPFTMIEVPLTTAEATTETFLMSDRVDWQSFATGVFSLFAFGFFLLGLSSLFSSFDRYRWRTIGAVVGLYVFQLVIFGLGKSADQLDWLRGFSFFNWYRPQKQIARVTSEGLWAPWSFQGADADAWFGPIVYPLLLIACGTVCYAAAFIIFRKRDLPAPL